MERPLKRHRGCNFATAEKSLFVEILQKYIAVIENKKTDGTTLKQKEAAWEKLCNEFNSFPSVSKRNVKQLKSFYDNFKRKSKKSLADEKVERMKTGGGPFYTTSILDDNSTKLLSLLKDQINPLDNTKDSDAFYHDEDHITNFIVSEEEPQILLSLPNEILCQTPETVLECQLITASASPTSEPEAASEPVPSASIQQSTQSQTLGLDTPCYVSTSRPVLQRKESETLKCRKNIASLAEERKRVIELECELLNDKKRKEDELRAVKFQVQEEKRKAYEAKRLYYERKLATITRSS